MVLRIKVFIVLLLVFIGCKTLEPIKINSTIKKESKLTELELKNWHLKDIEDDTILGISLKKTYEKILDKAPIDTIIVALLDNRIDSNHEDIKDVIWTNSSEIPNNQIDDDQNGYVDDINGWNFLGNSKGQNVDRANFETTRIIRKYSKKFESKSREEISNDLVEEFDLYQKAKSIHDESLKQVNYRLNFLDNADKEKQQLYKDLKKIYHDSLLVIDKIEQLTSKDSITNVKIFKLKNHLKYSDWSSKSRKVQNRYLNIYLNPKYKERDIIGDNVDDINDINYGNGNITASMSSSHNHSIKVAGVLAANRNNKIGALGISNALKVMPVCVSPTGDEQDKDIALGIRYAVDNGAKIIIITFTKFIVQNENWLSDAIKYASNHDALLVLSAGNSATNSDIKKTFPNDYHNSDNEFVNNVIVVGGINNSLNENLISSFSSYGKKTVDIFAPSQNIYTTFRNNKYGFDSGTSMSAPIVAGIATLIRSYYPNLSASEVKQIIMDSGVSYDIMVNKPSRSKEKELVPFSSLSKSGKIVNAYNALLMAEKVSKRKK